ncbi:putative alpha-1,6-mannanase (GH76 family) [Erwinia rhapontici]|nr:putative alpha-1,6-mannanase (GH76 family) [Erwinia rhapontici]
MQLAHVDKNSIRGTYNHAKYLTQLKKMTEWYSSLLLKEHYHYLKNSIKDNFHSTMPLKNK